MKFGAIVNLKMIDRRSSDPCGKLLSYLNEMEELSYHLGWLGHHRFSASTAFGGDEATEPSAPLPMFAALAARTRTMNFCTNIFLAPSRHPLEVAEEMSTINEIAGNRFILGASIGYKPDEFENCG